jgi:nucleotide-binding universal stress UspA family protein
MIENNSRILVPLDGTELSLRALERAKEEAVKSNSSPILSYVLGNTCFCPVGIKDFLSQIQDFDSSQQDYINVLKKGAELMINEALRGINQQGIEARFSIRIGVPADEILDVARDEKVVIIIMGSNGSLKRLNERKGIGSVFRWVMELADYPVILIR